MPVVHSCVVESRASLSLRQVASAWQGFTPELDLNQRTVCPGTDLPTELPGVFRAYPGLRGVVYSVASEEWIVGRTLDRITHENRLA